MAGGVGGLVEVDNAGAEIGFEVALERSASCRNWNEMTGSDKNYSHTCQLYSELWKAAALQKLVILTLAVVFQQQRPVGGGNWGNVSFRLDRVIIASSNECHCCKTSWGFWAE
jgi:hypothetical protein